MQKLVAIMKSYSDNYARSGQLQRFHLNGLLIQAMERTLRLLKRERKHLFDTLYAEDEWKIN